MTLTTRMGMGLSWSLPFFLSFERLGFWLSIWAMQANLPVNHHH
jgi:hypothetical protein